MEIQCAFISRDITGRVIQIEWKNIIPTDGGFLIHKEKKLAYDLDVKCLFLYLGQREKEKVRRPTLAFYIEEGLPMLPSEFFKIKSVKESSKK